MIESLQGRGVLTQFGPIVNGVHIVSIFLVPS